MEKEKKEEQKEINLAEQNSKDHEFFQLLENVSSTTCLERGLVKHRLCWWEEQEPIQPMITSRQIIIYILKRTGLVEVEPHYHRTRKPYDLSKIWECLKPEFPWVKNPMAFINSLFNIEKEFLFLKEFKITINPKTNHKEVIFTLNDFRWTNTGRLPKEIFVNFKPSISF